MVQAYGYLFVRGISVMRRTYELIVLSYSVLYFVFLVTLDQAIYANALPTNTSHFNAAFNLSRITSDYVFCRLLRSLP